LKVASLTYRGDGFMGNRHGFTGFEGNEVRDPLTECSPQIQAGVYAIDKTRFWLQKTCPQAQELLGKSLYKLLERGLLEETHAVESGEDDIFVSFRYQGELLEGTIFFEKYPHSALWMRLTRVTLQLEKVSGCTVALTPGRQAPLALVLVVPLEHE
jgi:hypothetical protein